MVICVTVRKCLLNFNINDTKCMNFRDKIYKDNKSIEIACIAKLFIDFPRETSLKCLMKYLFDYKRYALVPQFSII